MFKAKKYFILFLVALALSGVIILLFATRWGAGISPDSTVYIGTARNLLSGRGLSVPFGGDQAGPMTHYPPLFPTLLAVIGIFGMDPLNGARWLNAFLFGSNILLVGLVINRCTRGSIWISLFGSFLMLTSFDILSIHSMAWTEPAFIFFGLLGLFLLGSYIENPRPLLLFASSSMVALAFLARYPGVTFVATGIIGISFLSQRTYYRRVADSSIFAAISSLPMALWIIRSLYVAGSATNRKIVFHPITFDHVKSALFTFSSWSLPYRFSGVAAGIFWLAAVVGLSVFSILLLQRKSRLNGSDFVRHDIAKLPCLLVTFIVIYCVFLIVSISFLDALTPLDNRILSPVYVSGLVSILYIVHKLLRSIRGIRSLKIVSIVLCIVFAGSHISIGLRRSAGWVTDAHVNGRGYASKVWQHSEIMEQIGAFPSEIPIFTNGHDAIYILTGRQVSCIPRKVYPGTRQINDDYSFDLARMRDQLEDGDGVLVYFNTIKRLYLPSEDELKDELPLCLLTKGADGSIYALDVAAK